MTIEATIHQLESELRAAQLHSDIGTLDRLIDDALLFTGPDGSVVTKSDDLALHRSGGVRFTSLEASDVQLLRAASDVVVVAVRTRLAGEYHGTAFSGDFRYTRVWALRGDTWRVVAGHVSVVAAPS